MKRRLPAQRDQLRGHDLLHFDALIAWDRGGSNPCHSGFNRTLYLLSYSPKDSFLVPESACSGLNGELVLSYGLVHLPSPTTSNRDPEGSRTPDLCGFNTALSHTTELQDHLVEQFNVPAEVSEGHYSGHFG